MTSLPTAILISGRGTNMRVIAERAAAGSLPIEIRVVVSDRAAAEGLQAAAAMNIPTRVLAPRDLADRAAYDHALTRLLSEYEPQLVVLAGFMRILTPHFIGAFAGRILNVHPALLPNYRGLHTHRRVLEAGERTHGCTVHYVVEELDAGPVIIQGRLAVRPGEDETALSARVQRLEHIIYPRAVGWIAGGRLAWRAGTPFMDNEPLTPAFVEEEE